MFIINFFVYPNVLDIMPSISIKPCIDLIKSNALARHLGWVINLISELTLGLEMNKSQIYR